MFPGVGSGIAHRKNDAFDSIGRNTMDWEQFRRDDGTIDLNDAYNSWPGSLRIVGPKRRRQFEFLDNIEQLKPITSRQAAAIAISLAAQVEN